ncbi:hypothetical protein Tco_0744112 [Tanacetum coccineum]
MLGVTKEKEELFTLNIQVKQEVIEAIVDIESEKNLISSSLVEWLGLETTPHPQLYSLGWIKKDVDTQVNQQCCKIFGIFGSELELRDVGYPVHFEDAIGPKIVIKTDGGLMREALKDADVDKYRRENGESDEIENIVKKPDNYGRLMLIKNINHD